MPAEREERYDHGLTVTRAPSDDPLADAQGAILQAQVLSVARELVGYGHDVEPSYRAEGAESVLVVRGEIDHLQILKDTVEDRYGHELADVEEDQGPDPSGDPARAETLQLLSEKMDEIQRSQEEAMSIAARLTPNSNGVEVALSGILDALANVEDALETLAAAPEGGGR